MRQTNEDMSTASKIMTLTGVNVLLCPICKQGSLRQIADIPRPTYWDSS